MTAFFNAFRGFSTPFIHSKMKTHNEQKMSNFKIITTTEMAKSKFAKMKMSERTRERDGPDLQLNNNSSFSPQWHSGAFLSLSRWTCEFIFFLSSFVHTSLFDILIPKALRGFFWIRYFHGSWFLVRLSLSLIFFSLSLSLVLCVYVFHF